MKSLKSQAGFTLVEIVIVAAIAGLLATMGGVSYMSSSERFNFQNERAKFFQALNRARNTAMTRQECVRVRIGADNNLLTQVFEPAGADRLCTSGSLTPGMELSPIKFHQTTVLGEFSEGGDTLMFNTSGGLDSANVVSFTLRDRKSNSAQFQIFPAIGQIRMR